MFKLLKLAQKMKELADKSGGIDAALSALNFRRDRAGFAAWLRDAGSVAGKLAELSETEVDDNLAKLIIAIANDEVASKALFALLADWLEEPEEKTGSQQV